MIHKIINKNRVLCLFGLLITLSTLSSCLKRDPLTKDITRYSEENFNTYAELFEAFWQGMNQRYNYFYEQEQGGMDWDAIHDKYYPKFAALTTYKRNPEMSDNLILTEADSARSYFTQIINPIIDRHFGVGIRLPASRNVDQFVQFNGGMLNPDKSVKISYATRQKYMPFKLEAGSFATSNLGSALAQLLGRASVPGVIGGFLKSDPGVYYFAASGFSLTQFNITLDKTDYCSPQPDNKYILTLNEINNSKELNAITDMDLRNKVKASVLEKFNRYEKFYKSSDVTLFNKETKKFTSNEIISDSLVAVSNRIIQDYKSLPPYAQLANYDASLQTTETLPFFNWFIKRLDEDITRAYDIQNYNEVAGDINTNGFIYTQFYNLLHEGKIKKLILDLRSNGGGQIVDARNFTDRFITKVTTFAYQRTREGNKRFDYTPWIPVATQKHKFGIPNAIPIAIMLDKGSASMSELSSLMLLTQGDQVFTVGDYSAGATAGLGPYDEFNGGLQGQIGANLVFYMPIMATKTVDGKVIEGKGITPNYPVASPTLEEVKNASSSPATFDDKTLNKAIEILRTKN